MLNHSDNKLPICMKFDDETWGNKMCQYGKSVGRLSPKSDYWKAIILEVMKFTTKPKEGYLPSFPSQTDDNDDNDDKHTNLFGAMNFNQHIFLCS